MAYNPKSLKNLRPMLDSETANAAREKGLETRRANKEAREMLKMSMSEWKKTVEILGEVELSAVDLLKVQAAKYAEQGDMPAAVDIWKSIAEFEAPKLARIDQTNTDGNLTDLSEDELDAKIRKLLSEDD